MRLAPGPRRDRPGASRRRLRSPALVADGAGRSRGRAAPAFGGRDRSGADRDPAGRNRHARPAGRSARRWAVARGLSPAQIAGDVEADSWRAGWPGFDPRTLGHPARQRAGRGATLPGQPQHLGRRGAGLGLDRTEAELVADPALSETAHELEIHAAPGKAVLVLGGRTVPPDGDPADYTTLSVMRLLKRRDARLAI